MKKSKLILLALLGLFFFNSCEKDKDDNPPSKPISSSESYKTITKLKNLTGIGFSQCNDTILNLGFTYQSGGELDEDVILHTYLQEESLSLFLIYEAKGIIFLTAFARISEKDTALSDFEKYSKESIAYMIGKSYEYNGECTDFNAQNTLFNSTQDFTKYYSENKYNLEQCAEGWETSSEAIASMYEDNGGMNMSILMYLNIQHAPPSILEKTIKNKALKNINSIRKFYKF